MSKNRVPLGCLSGCLGFAVALVPRSLRLLSWRCNQTKLERPSSTARKDGRLCCRMAPQGWPPLSRRLTGVDFRGPFFPSAGRCYHGTPL
ncbi:hypothetical protein BGX38DRAFT_1188471 [Terfezia claveryi]|nr:hypothetical protein BGX38DRAFT_1188471 [Terfezia claveryi]